MTQLQALAILKTGVNVFLTGEPGSGKTYAINQYVAFLRSRGIEPAITASTGIAATHIGGMTIHSWSGIGIKTTLSQHDLQKIASSQYIVKRVRRAKILIVEEVSMLTSETLSMIDAVCRKIKQRPDPFGGIQVVFVGDFFQLPPVVKREAQDNAQPKLMEESSSRFAYDGPAWKEVNPIVCYLTEQYRQDDRDFLTLLSAIRRNAFTIDHLHQIEARKTHPQSVPGNAPKLFTHNIDVDRINDDVLAKVPGQPRVFPMSAQGPDALVSALTKGCLSPETLYLKVGASVMFTKNNPKEGFVNGTLGIVEDFNKTSDYPVVTIRNGRRIAVEPMNWTVEENGSIRAQITQLPLRLAWAITVHKSQGMTLDKAVMDLSGVFEFGQGYVALSRIRRLSDLYILGWNERAFQVHPDIVAKDGAFHAQSASTVDTFTKMGRDKIAAMHKQFIALCGGKIVLDDRVGLSKKPVAARERQIARLLGNKESVLATQMQSRQFDFKIIRETYPHAYFPWDTKQDEKLKSLFARGLSVGNLSKIFGRKSGAIRSRLVKLELTKEGGV
ncbi:MAG: PIF1 family DEAD/DEAH box helicase [Patescibacteria group bacterium]